MKSNKTARSKKYLDYIKSQRCFVTQQMGEIVAHHVRVNGAGGIGLKPSDYRTLPLLDSEHKKLHQIGENQYWHDLRVSPEDDICEYLLGYFEISFKHINPNEMISALETFYMCLESGNA